MRYVAGDLVATPTNKCPILIDELLSDDTTAAHILATNGGEAINLKISKAGGLDAGAFETYATQEVLPLLRRKQRAQTLHLRLSLTWSRQFPVVF